MKSGINHKVKDLMTVNIFTVITTFICIMTNKEN